jgi:ferredoxin
LRLPSICHQGRCLTCAAKLLKGEVDQAAAVSYFEADRAAGFTLLCTARPRTDLVIETHQQDAMRKHRQAEGLPAPYA